MRLSPPVPVFVASARFGNPSLCAGHAGILKGDALARINKMCIRDRCLSTHMDKWKTTLPDVDFQKEKVDG